MENKKPNDQIDIRILVLDDEIQAVSGDIQNSLANHIKQQKFPPLETLQNKESEPVFLVDLIPNVKIKITFRCNAPHMKNANLVKRDIEAQLFNEKYDLVLLDDQWGEENNAGQDKLLESILTHVMGPNGHPLINLFTRHVLTERQDEDVRFERFKNIIAKNKLDQSVIFQPKEDKTKLLATIVSAVEIKSKSLKSQNTDNKGCWVAENYLNKDLKKRFRESSVEYGILIQMFENAKGNRYLSEADILIIAKKIGKPTTIESIPQRMTRIREKIDFYRKESGWYMPDKFDGAGYYIKKETTI
jgi:hypothetical protein